MKVKEIKLPFNINKPVLAFGSQTKNTICFAAGRIAKISPLHNDLSLLKDYFSFEKDAKFFIKKRPRIVAFDLHPEYQSTKYAVQLSASNYQLSAVQHHHAHIASCMAENGLRNQSVIGVAFDGTGLGSDQNIWGAEFLVCNYKKFRRLAHLKEIPLVGGERAILEPWRLVAAWFNFSKGYDKEQLLKRIYHSGINSLKASSMGRLFDAAASIILNRKKAFFEAELAIELEKLAVDNKFKLKGYNFRINKQHGDYVIDPYAILKNIVSDLKKGRGKRDIASQFHFSIARMIVDVAVIIRKEQRVNVVVLSGGVFQNKVLLSMSLELLRNEGFKVITHKNLSCNDSCLSLGQAVIANFRG